jgi:hypothetical protein
MQRLSRRQVFGALGVFGSSGLLAGCGPSAASMAAPGNAGQENTVDLGARTLAAWNYTPLDPAAVAECAYRIYPQGGCMYAVVGSVMTELARKVGDPFRSFPFEMMRFGDGGVGGWGSLCGVVNGGAALIGLFHHEKAKETREELITELCVWYESTALPQFVPAKAEWADHTAPSVAGSLLCHISVAQWCKTSGCGAYGMDKKERCRRLATDGAIQIVQILNRWSTDNLRQPCALAPEVKACLTCHGPKELGDTMGKTRCATCHQFSKKHP